MALFAIALLFMPGPLAAKDFPEPLLAADPLAASSGPGLPAGFSGAFEYANFLLSHDYVDSFYLRSSVSPIIVDAGSVFALNFTYETALLCGPVGPGQTAANIAAFWMNAVQFEYGLYASARLPGSIGLHLLAEYSRTSQHPLHSGNSYTYSQVSTDVLMLGLSMPEFRVGPIEGRAYLRFGYTDIFAFWKSSLPKPRVSWICKPAIEASLPIGANLAIVARAQPEIFVDRYKKTLDVNVFGELGIAAIKGNFEDEFLVTLYATRDSELLDETAHPTFEAGLAFRLAASRL